METIVSINSAINNFVWGIPAMVCILGIGLYLSIRTGFIQVRKFGLAMKETFGKIFSKDTTKEAVPDHLRAGRCPRSYYGPRSHLGGSRDFQRTDGHP